VKDDLDKFIDEQLQDPEFRAAYEALQLIDPDCKAGKCDSCVGGPCQHHCHGEGANA
jgi:hypothetical protein